MCKIDGYKPLSDVFELLKDERYVAFLDSAEHGAQGRFSIVGIKPFCIIEQVGDRCLIDGRPVDEAFFDALRARQRAWYEPNESHLPLTGGALGYLGYDFGRALNGVSTRHAASCSMPDAQMVFYDMLLIEDHEQRALYLCTQGKTINPDQARIWAESLVDSCPDASKPARTQGLAPFSSRFTEHDYRQALERMVEYMLDGHVYVANMTQQLVMSADKSPYDIYRYLRTYNPAPFSAYMHAPGFDICCSSMERFLLVRDGHVVTRPIKGTRPRGSTPEEDARNRTELFESPKDNSELLMIVDLERNDLSCACKPGSVKMQPDFTVESYPTVFHLVATVEGDLKAGATALDVVQHAFPGGSITGAPKIRAMEIIDELERSARGLYTGSIGYFSNAGDCDLNVVIRTLVCCDGAMTLGVGGGITAESDFDFEYEETLQKALALREAVGRGGETTREGNT